MKSLKIYRPSKSFYEDVWCEKKTLQDMFQMNGDFFLDFKTQYFVDIFSEPLKSLLTNKIRNCSIFNKNLQNDRSSVLFYKDVWYQRTNL